MIYNVVMCCFLLYERKNPMRKLLSRVLSALIAALLILSASALALPDAHTFDTPEGYDPHDYQKAAAFLEQTDNYGVKNGVKVSPAYDPEDPESWNYSGERFVWTERSGVLKLESVDLSAVSGRLCGAFDLSGCTALALADCSGSALTSADVSGCAALDTLIVKNCSISSLDVSGCASLRLLNCANNALSALDVSECPSLRFLECRWNQIPELDLSACPGLTVLICTDNRMKTLDLSHNPLLGSVAFLRMVDPGNQFISCYIATDPEYTNTPEYFVSADCYDGCSTFNGWYTADGRLLAEHTVFAPQPEDGGFFVARYESDGTTPGDADGSGEVDIADALTILRTAMSLVSHYPTASHDVDGDGAVTLTDAMLILRRAMGLFGAE